jgi:hypothetical protein
MRRRGVVTLLAVAALVLTALAWSSRPGRATGGQRQARPNATSEAAVARHTMLRSAETPAMPTRDLFRFGDSQSPMTRPALAPTASAVVPAAAATAPPLRVRLIGFVRTQRRLKAVVAVEGAINVLGPGEEASGFRVLDLDEDAARVRLRTPEGDEMQAVLAQR